MLLRAALGTTAPMPSTVVVTHFDLDHWMGLKAFADASASGSARVRLIYPRFPGHLKPLQAILLAYQTLHLTAPERSAMDLVRAWEGKAAALERTAASAGYRFEAVGTRWKVLWPPEELGASVSLAFNRIAKESEDLAQAYEPLGRALDWAKESWVNGDGTSQTDETSDGSTAPVDEDVPLFTEDEIAPEFDDDDLLDSYGTDNFADAPDELRERLRKNRRDVQRINNELSLVLEETHGRLLNLGDIQKWGLNALLRSGATQQCYDVILAPHHGTQASGKLTSNKFPWSRRVVAQNGAGHRPRLKKKFLSARTLQLTNTADVGSVAISAKYHAPPKYCRCQRP